MLEKTTSRLTSEAATHTPPDYVGILKGERSNFHIPVYFLDTILFPGNSTAGSAVSIFYRQQTMSKSKEAEGRAFSMKLVDL